jgi:RNA polymerase sigma factor (sigma-70 family)
MTDLGAWLGQTQPPISVHDVRTQLVCKFRRRRINGPVVDAEDLAHDTIKTLILAVQTRAPSSADEAFRLTFHIANHKLIDHLRRRRYIPLDEEIIAWMELEHAAAEVSRSDEQQKENLTRMKSCLRHLPKADRALITEYYGHSYGEERAHMAARMHISRNALMIRAWRIRSALRTAM